MNRSQLIKRVAEVGGVSVAAECFGLTEKGVKYHVNKTHNRKHGRRRWAKFTRGEEKFIQVCYEALLAEDNTRTIKEYASILSDNLATPISATWLHGRIQHWGFSVKVPETRQISKYTDKNIRYTSGFCKYFVTVLGFDEMLSKVKFLDESSFDRRRLHSRRAYSKVGHIARVVSKYKIGESFSLTLLLSPDGSSIYTNYNANLDQNFIVYRHVYKQ